MTKRVGMSKKLRFEVFKRDSFECQYCGATPPGVVLHVDHVRPVADGGTNDVDNLVTACQPCNSGKGARLLSSVPPTLKEKAAAVKEREEQIRGYQEIMDAKRDRMEDELWRVADLLIPRSSVDGMNRDWLVSIGRFNERLGVHEVMDAAEVARAKFYGARRTFLYFCGICWQKIRDQDA